MLTPGTWRRRSASSRPRSPHPIRATFTRSFAPRILENAAAETSAVPDAFWMNCRLCMHASSEPSAFAGHLGVRRQPRARWRDIATDQYLTLKHLATWNLLMKGGLPNSTPARKALPSQEDR